MKGEINQEVAFLDTLLKHNREMSVLVYTNSTHTE